MADSNNSNRENAPNWWTKVSLKEWAVIIGGIGFFYLNIVGGVETLKTSFTELKVEIKELKTALNQVVIINTQLRTEFNSEFKSIDERVKKKKKKKNINSR